VAKNREIYNVMIVGRRVPWGLGSKLCYCPECFIDRVGQGSSKAEWHAA
jgi:hypothetical protein